MRRLLPLVAVAALVLIAVATGLSAARGPNPNAVPTAQQVDERTMSPFCVGLTLAACPSSEALQLRATIARMVADGRTNQEIDSFLLANYPKWRYQHLILRQLGRGYISLQSMEPLLQERLHRSDTEEVLELQAA